MHRIYVYVYTNIYVYYIIYLIWTDGPAIMIIKFLGVTWIVIYSNNKWNLKLFESSQVTKSYYYYYLRQQYHDQVDHGTLYARSVAAYLASVTKTMAFLLKLF